MTFRGLAFVLLMLGLPAWAQHEQPSSPTTAAQSSSLPVSAAQRPEDNTPATAEPKPDAAAKVDLTPDASGKLSQEQMQQLFRVVADKDVENDKRLRDYTYIEREVESKLDGKGQTKHTEVKTYEVLEIYGEQVQRLIEKDDKPLDAKEAAKEEEKIQKAMDKRKNESEDERKKREQKADKDHEDERKFVREVADAYDFKLVGTEPVGGREAWVIDAEPRPGFEAHTKEAKFLSKIHGRVWVDKGDLQLAKMDVQVLDTISWGLFLARFHKGSRVMMEQTRVNDEVWLPRTVSAKIDVRLALVKNFDVGVEQTYRDYKKFRTSAKIVSVGEVQEQK